MRYFSENRVKRLKLEDNSNDNQLNVQSLQFIDISGEVEELVENDFRKIPVFPTAEEISDSTDPTIDSNIIKGKYKSVDHYLDIQYRLLREDFVRPLRRGINEYINCLNSGRSVHKIQDIYHYKNVKIFRQCEKSLISFWVSFDTEGLKDIDWKNSERLFFGSMVCLSCDNFQTFRFGTITGNRFEDNLIKGLFQMKFETSMIGKDLSSLTTDSDKDFMSKTYSMVESKAYFEAYRHTMVAIQRFTSDNFPLKKYIVEVDNHMSSPSHLTSQTVYDFSHLIVSPKSCEEVVIIDDDLSIIEDKRTPDLIQYKNVKLFDTNQWPTAEEIGFDDSQYQAFRASLLNQLVLIQGPPGCGKTFIGLKIVETLYINKYMNNCFKSKPILIVCYTNHALDQFLEGILRFCKNLIRIGGGSKSESLKKYTLRQGKRSNEKSIFRKDIIGMTTTGAAKFRYLLESVDPMIVVIEEAAEVLESHVITSLTKSTEHLILIGDHKQLRPNTADYGLTKDHNLNISLFERMINNKMPFIQLNLQHRMRPEISGLLTPHIYDHLFDHKSVYKYEDIRGIKKNMFFINHSQNESSNVERMSKSNEFEAKFIIRLAKHLIYQNYDKTQITILTLYSSQYSVIKRLLRDDSFYDGIRVQVLDSFQGEENDIILLSFVRSNYYKEIGFLKTSNRVNVALSRAKKGLYCVGNFDCLSEKSDLWKNICKYLTTNGAIGRALDLFCPNHPKKVISVSEVKHFDAFPFGGCLEPCLESLECSHSCPFKTCHPLSHKQIQCTEKCLKINCDLKHKCQRVCHFPDECKPCVYEMSKTVPKCGHNIIEFCSSNLFCYNPCERLLECGHKCLNLCGNQCQLICREEVERVVKKCGHKVMVECFTSDGLLVCGKECQNWLSCGHRCHLKCSEECEDKCDKCRPIMSGRHGTIDWPSNPESDSTDD